MFGAIFPAYTQFKLPSYLTFLLVALSLVFKILLAVATYGTNDIDMWESSAVLAQGDDAIRLYQQPVPVLHEGERYDQQVFNHPPLIIPLLRLLDAISNQLALPFRLVFRVFTSLIDLASFFVITAILRRRGVHSNLALLAFCPAAILIAGFHGNLDPLMIFFLLATVWSVESGQKPWLHGLFFALALNVKVLPLFLLPALFFALKGRRARLICFGVIALASLAIWLPYLRQDPMAVIQSTLGYNSQAGLWGIGYLLRGTFLFTAYSLYAKYAILALSIALAWWLNRRPVPISLFDQFGITLFLFLFLSPGFGIQYLYWLTPWAVTLGWRVHLFHSLAAGAFAFVVYHGWCGGFPWYFANSIYRGSWHGNTHLLQLLAWASTGLVLSAYYRRYQPAPY